ncbi:hypothetical protein PENCOP_c001G06587 [Penicillium coprophilum]|uniref:DUF7587 domain-containing protein n=1 Tax=Penicillium coprophilum TaxID=36646 RepID=A0A1V6V6M5_9EURO|nr:hypothetical protein PENCOP_c001G06587 [Penicillium coprophilum]
MDGEWKSIIQQIKSTAITLLLPLFDKIEDDIDTTQWRTRETVVVGQRTEYPHEAPYRMPSPLRQQREEETSHSFAGSDDQSSGSITMTVGHSQERTDSLEDIDFVENDVSVVTSHGKTCLWCSHGVTIDEVDGIDDQTSMSNNPKENNNPDQSQQPQYQHAGYQDWGQQHHHQDHQHDHEMAMQGVPRDKLPPLLFRWSNCDSQGVNSKTHFLAGIFCDSGWFNPEDLPQSRFESLFESHVTKQEVNTPFISTSQSPLSPLHRAIAGQKGAILTVIDTSKLETKVFYAYPLAVRMRTLVINGWKGFGEFLIWGSIPTEAIAHTVEIASLQQITQSHRDINRLIQLPLIRSVPRCKATLREMLAFRRKLPFPSGRTLGKLLTLLQVPVIHWENLAYEFAKAWGWRHKKEITLLLNGIRSPPPYLPEELSDSESEAPWPTPQKTPQKMHFSSNRDSDIDYEPPETDEDPESTSESEGMTKSRSMSMCDDPETDDEEKFSTHETLSSEIFPEDYGVEDLPKQVQGQEVIDLTSDNEETSSKCALQRDWPSDDDPYMYPDTPTKTHPSQSSHEKRSTRHLVLNGQTDMDFFEKFRHWS